MRKKTTMDDEIGSGYANRKAAEERDSARAWAARWKAGMRRWRLVLPNSLKQYDRLVGLIEERDAARAELAACRSHFTERWGDEDTLEGNIMAILGWNDSFRDNITKEREKRKTIEAELAATMRDVVMYASDADNLSDQVMRVVSERDAARAELTALRDIAERAGYSGTAADYMLAMQGQLSARNGEAAALRRSLLATATELKVLREAVLRMADEMTEMADECEGARDLFDSTKELADELRDLAKKGGE